MSKPKKCVGKEGFERMNYLYQTCNALATENPASHIASVLHSNLLIAVSKKTVQRLDIGLKRTLCKGCHSLLIAGVTARVRVKKKIIKWTCFKCCTVKSFDIHNKNYQPWFQREESIVEVLDYNQDTE